MIRKIRQSTISGLQLSLENLFLHTSIIKIEKFRYFSGGR